MTVTTTGTATGTGVLAITAPVDEDNVTPSTTENYAFTFDGKSTAGADPDGMHLNISP